MKFKKFIVNCTEQRDNLFKKMHKAGYEWDENMKMVAMIV